MNKNHIILHSKCKGQLRLRWANGFSACYECRKCDKWFWLPTETQVKERPWILEFELKRNKLFIPKGVLNQ